MLVRLSMDPNPPRRARSRARGRHPPALDQIGQPREHPPKKSGQLHGAGQAKAPSSRSQTRNMPGQSGPPSLVRLSMDPNPPRRARSRARGRHPPALDQIGQPREHPPKKSGQLHGAGQAKAPSSRSQTRNMPGQSGPPSLVRLCMDPNAIRRTRRRARGRHPPALDQIGQPREHPPKISGQLHGAGQAKAPSSRSQTRNMPGQSRPHSVEQVTSGSGNFKTDDKYIVEDESVPVPIDRILLPIRTLPDLEFPDNLKSHTEYNRNLVREKNKLIQLPCQPNVVTLFENYIRYLARKNFSDNKTTKRESQPEVLNKEQLEIRYTLCVETLDGVRICFNTFLFEMLLVNKDEQAQYHEALKMTLQPPQNNIISQNGEQDYDNVPNYEELESNDNKNNVKAKRGNTHKPTSQYASSDISLTKSHCSKTVKDTFEKACDEYVLKADSWKAVPDSTYDEEIKQPAVVYGVYHLLRLLENLPKILARTKIDDERLSVVYSYCNGLLKYLSTQTYLFEKQDG
eukprot:XP_016661567.1 PREDICTED: male-specific lethal 3 homolog [Acyrthosiphon pisum]